MSNAHKQATYGLSAGEWLNIFLSAGVEAERLKAAKSNRSRATIMGSFLARLVNREVGIEVNGRAGTATLHSRPGRSGSKYYYFEVAWAPIGPACQDNPPDNHLLAIKPQKTPPAGRARPKADFTKPSQPPDSPMDRNTGTGSTAANDETW